MNWDALYCSGNAFYRSPEEPDPGDLVTLRFRTLREDAAGVYIEFPALKKTEKMKAVASDRYFDYFEITVKMGDETLSYVFWVEGTDGSRVRYNRLGVSDSDDPALAFQLIPGYHVPDWIKGTIMYQILIDRFRDGNPDNNVLDHEYIYLGRYAEGVKDWGAPPQPFDVHRFYGGDLQGVEEKLDYLYSLGVRVIYFNPLFVSPSNHKYDTQDYGHVDPHVGAMPRDNGALLADGDTDNGHAERYRIRTTSRENLEASDLVFQHFVEACHARGMRVIIDGVFNHCGSFNKWMNKSRFYRPEEGYQPGAYERKDSPYTSYFGFCDSRDEAWPENETYEKWWGNDTLPKLNYEESETLQEEVLAIARKWVSAPYCCDGWRLDVAADLGHSEAYNHDFWKRFRRAVKEANPEAVILAEHYGDPYAWLQGDEWDSIMNYDAFMEPVSWFLTGMEKHSDSYNPTLIGDGQAFFRSMLYNMSRMPESAIASSMNQLSNHDHSRFMTRTNHYVGRLSQLGPEAASQNINPAVYRLGAMMQMTWPGAPTIYYGDEAGVCGLTEPDSRRTYPWGHEDLALIDYHMYLSRARLNNRVLQRGSVMRLMAGHNYVVYARIYENEVAIIPINASGDEYALQIPVWLTGVTDTTRLRRILLTDSDGYNAGETSRFPEQGCIRCYMKPYAGKIYLADLMENYPTG